MRAVVARIVYVQVVAAALRTELGAADGAMTVHADRAAVTAGVLPSIRRVPRMHAFVVVGSEAVAGRAECRSVHGRRASGTGVALAQPRKSVRACRARRAA